MQLHIEWQSGVCEGSPHSTSVQHGLSRGEGLGDDYNQGCLRPEAVQSPSHINRIHIGQEAQIPALCLRMFSQLRMQDT